MFWGGQCCLVSIGGAGSYLPAHRIPKKKKLMIDRTLTTPIIYLKVYLSYRVIVKIHSRM